MTKSPFVKLGIAPNSSKDVIKSAYRKLAKQCHPDLRADKSNAAEEFRILTMVYEEALAAIGSTTTQNDFTPPENDDDSNPNWKGRRRSSQKKEKKTKPPVPPKPDGPLVMDAAVSEIDEFEFQNFSVVSRFIFVKDVFLYYGGTVHVHFLVGSGYQSGFRFMIPPMTKNGQIFRFKFPQGFVELQVVSEG